MDLRGHDDDSDGDGFLPQHRRLGLGRLYQEGELGRIAPPSPPSSTSATAVPTPSSLNYNHSGILTSGSAFRRPPLLPSPLSSSTMPPSAATPLSSHRQPQQLPHQQQHGGGGGRGGGGSASESGDNRHRKLSPVQLPSSLDPKLSLVVDRPSHHHHQQQQQQQQQGETRKDNPDAATPRASQTPAGAPPAEGGGGSSSTPRSTEAAAALAATRTRPSSAAASNTGAAVRYRECLKNHAARVGGHVLDGCGEFMPGGEEGTPEALKCAACTCHRSFHRKEVEGREEAEGLFVPVSSASSPRGVSHGNPRLYYLPGGAGNGAYPGGGAARGSAMGSSGARGLHNPPPLSLQTPSTHGRHQHHTPVGMLPAPSSGVGAFAPPPSGVMAYGGGGGGNDDEENTNYSGGTTTTESSSEEMQAHMLAVAGTSTFHHGAPPTQALQTPPAGAPQPQQQYQVVGASGSSKKRYRTKFTTEQREMMAGFAERVGWRMQKQDEGTVEQFCREAGVSRQVFKVWMHNNKHALLKSKHPQPQPQPQTQRSPQGEQQQQLHPQQQQSSSSS